MFRKDQFGIVFNTIFCIMFAVCIPLFMEWRNGTMGFENFCKDFIPGFTVALAIATYINLKEMGDGFARRCGVKNENGLLFHVLRVVSITFVMTLIMTLVMTFLAVGFSLGPAFFLACLGSFPAIFGVALVVAFITFAFGIRLTAALCVKPPKEISVHP